MRARPVDIILRVLLCWALATALVLVRPANSIAHDPALAGVVGDQSATLAGLTGDHGHSHDDDLGQDRMLAAHPHGPGVADHAHDTPDTVDSMTAKLPQQSRALPPMTGVLVAGDADGRLDRPPRA